jgi:hypothetical protein
VKDFHVRASDAVRRYVEAVFGVPSLEMTTGEVLLGLERVEAPGEARSVLRRFLDQCDLVKFAKVRPDDSTAITTLGLGRDFVERTIGWAPPEPPVPQAPADPPAREEAEGPPAPGQATEAPPPEDGAATSDDEGAPSAGTADLPGERV